MLPALLLALAGIVLLPAPLGEAQGGRILLTVYHTGDIHGHIDPGAARLAGYIRSRPEPKLLLDAGDWFLGTPVGTLSRGRALADLFNAVPYDAVGLGNHEFDLGVETLKDLVRRVKVPVLAANVYERKTGRRPSWVLPWIIKTVDGVKVGIFGLLTSRMPRLAVRGNIAGLEFRPELDEAKKAVRHLRRKGAGVIIAVSHLGFENPERWPFVGDQTLAALVPGIDLIVGGHSHTVLERPLRDASHGTLIAHAGSGLERLGKVVLEIDRVSGRVVSSTGSLVDLRSVTEPPDSRVLGIIRRHVETVSPLVDVVLATASVRLKGRGEPESPLGSWMTDCVRSASGADVALQNSGGIRADLPAGLVTLRALFNIMPFENRVLLLRMRGRILRTVLDASGGAGALQVSGARIVYRRSRGRRWRRRGKRIASVAVGGRPLDDAALYVVAVPDFLVERESSVPYELVESREASGVFLRDILAGCARREGLIESPRPGRIVKR